jgi:hypothetical protein
MPLTRRAVRKLAAAALLLVSARAAAAVKRTIEVRHLEYRGEGVARLFFNVLERDGDTAYPVSTLERSMVGVRVVGLDDAKATIVRSLTTVGSSPGAVQRATVVAFHAGTGVPDRGLSTLRAEISELLPKLPSAYLTVAAVDGDGARIVGAIKPGSADNVVAIQREILALDESGAAYDRDGALCFAAKRFREWGLADFARSDQKVAVVVGPSGTQAADGPGAACARELAARDVRIFEIVWGGDGARAKGDRSGAVTTLRIKSPLDVSPALANVASLLNDEYIAETGLPPVPAELQPIALETLVRYHGESFHSETVRLPAVIPDLLPPPPAPPEVVGPPKPAPGPERWVAIGAAAVVVVAASALGVRHLRHRARTTTCNSCGRRVAKSYSDCGFRDKSVVARLVVLDGAHSGRIIPLRTGDNELGRLPWTRVPVRDRGVRWRRHGTLRIEGTKALYTPAPSGRRRRRDRVNGWPVTEPRLLGVGYVLQVGPRKLRFEARNDAWR